ncbi:MAG: outer membrane beta-barrel protein [Tannerellaceae bacterium]|jgi:hypothetical protein|nr:outer membrane beta-barrel protein [Tannerellaceae bacterium]
MKSRRILLVLMVISFAFPAWAQRSAIEIKGVVVEEKGTIPVEQATVRLLSVKDSSFVKGVATSRDGSFALTNIRPGDYLLHISFIGFDPLFQPLQITGRTNPVNLGKLTLNDGSVMLGEVVAIGKAAEMVVRNDTTEYNAESFKVTEGSMLEDLLKKMPGVEIDSEGKVTVNGKEVKKMMVDGKEFFSDDPKVASKNLPAKMVDKVQVYDKKSDMTMMTGFDDGDEETVINLTIRPGMKQGWFGNAFAGYGSKERYEGNAMVNRFINNDQFTFMGGFNNTNNMGFTDLASTVFQGMGGGGMRMRGGGGAGNGITSSGNAGANFSKEFNSKITLGGNARYSHSDNDANSRSREQTIMAGDSIQYEDARDVRSRQNDNIGVNLRLEWKPDTLTNIIFRPDFSYSKSRSLEEGASTTLGGGRNVRVEDLDTMNVSESNSLSDGTNYSMSGRLEVSRKLNTKGRVLSGSFSGSYNKSDEDGTNYSNIRYANRTDELDQLYNYTNTGYSYRAFVSWVEPLGRSNFLQAAFSFNQSRQEALKYTWSKDEAENYTQLDTAYSQSYRNNFINQRASLSFKAVREKYNYTIGFNVDPSYSESETFIADTVLSDISRHVVNFSPMVQFNYLFNRQTNLRINYDGRTSQPSIAQLQPVPNVSNPKNTVIGNPNLNPRYTNDVFIRFQKFMPEKQTTFMLMSNINYVVNDIVSDVKNLGGGVKETSYRNTNGNYNGNIRMIVNTPLKNRKFSINSMTMASYSNSNAYIDNQKSLNRNMTLSERAGIDFRSDILDLGINGNIRYNKVDYSLQPESNMQTFNYGVGGTTVVYLPLSIKLESDISYSTNSGYQAGYKLNEVMWNASASKSFLKGNQATLRLKMYDILQQRSNISQNITSTGYTESEYNTLSSYFMVHFIYRFSIFKGGASASDVMDRRPGRGQGGSYDGPPRQMQF